MKKYLLLFFIGFFAFSTTSHSQSVSERKLENRIVTAVEAYDNEDYDTAARILNAVLAEDETCDAAWYYLGLIAIANNDAELAQEYLKNAVDLDPGNFWYRQRQALLYAYTSQEEVAVDMYEKLMADFPDKSDLYFDMVDLYIAQGEYEKALNTIYDIERVFGQTESLTLMAYRILLVLERNEEALEYLLKYNSKYSSPQVLSVLAEKALEQYDDVAALAYFEEALELDPAFPQAQLGKAEVYRMTLCYDDFFSALLEYVENQIVDAASKADYLMALVENGDPKLLSTYLPQMDAVIERFMELHPKDTRTYEVGGMYYLYTYRPDVSKQYFVDYVREYPDNYNASVALVEYLAYMQEWEEVSRESMSAFSRFPEEVDFLEMACIGDYNLGDYETVLERCDLMLDLVAEDPARRVKTLSTIGDVHHLMGESKKGYKAYETALKLDPDNVYILNNYAYYLSLEGRNLKKAYAMSQKTVEAEPDNATYLDTFGWILYLQGRAVEARPVFKNAMLHGGKESSVILDHYAEVLYALGEHSMAFIYWNLALQKDNGDVPGLKEKVEARRQQSKE